ncbi:unnamed protein product, partial [marine sediment metagenome]
DFHQTPLSAVACKALLGRLVRIRQMISNELLYSRDDLFFELRWALCYPHGEIVQFLGISLQPFAVTKQEREQGGYGNSFITILKRMIFDHKVEENTSLTDQRWIQGLA